MIDAFFDLSATLLHCAIQFGLACAIVFFSIIAICAAVTRFNNKVLGYQQILKDNKTLKSEIGRLRWKIWELERQCQDEQ